MKKGWTFYNPGTGMVMLVRLDGKHLGKIKHRKGIYSFFQTGQPPSLSSPDLEVIQDMVRTKFGRPDRAAEKSVLWNAWGTRDALLPLPAGHTRRALRSNRGSGHQPARVTHAARIVGAATSLPETTICGYQITPGWSTTQVVYPAFLPDCRKCRKLCRDEGYVR